jgi:glutathione synthase/RimK-type ligase-like ATP-grasp enzyme
MVKRNFVEMLRELCEKHNFEIVTFCDEWVTQITDKKTGKVVRTIGYNFPLNTYTSGYTANDKGLTNDLLAQAGVPRVEHYFIYSDELRARIKPDVSLQSYVENILSKCSLPVVVKPCRGYQGRLVSLCKTEAEVLQQVKQIAAVEDVCISPFEESEFEYRFYFLDEEILLAYKKKRIGDWKHNLSSGAVPEVLDLADYSETESLWSTSVLPVRNIISWR